MKKSLLLALLAMTSSVAIGCSSGTGGKATRIEIINYCGGVGKEWLERAIDKFTEMKKDYSYEPGKTGVEIKPSNTKSVDTSSMKGATKHIYVTEDNGFPYDLAANGSLLNIDSWVKETGTDGKTIESKLDSSIQSILKYNGEYYALPHYELYPGVTYDYELFVKKNLFLADPAESDDKVISVNLIGKQYRFAKQNGRKACGNDGIFGTDDDGLPTSLEEFFALTQRMLGMNIGPILFPGNHQDYSSLMMEGMLASLVGKSGIRSFYNFDGVINHVKGYQNDGNYIFEGSGINTPIVEQITLTEKTGYLIRETEERYAISCLIQLLDNYKNQTAFPSDVTTMQGNTNEVVQKLFLAGSRAGNNARDYGMLCEGNYWLNEAQGRFDDFYLDYPTYNKETNPRDVRWMSLPTKISGTVTEGNGSTPCLMDTGNSYYLINKSSYNRASSGLQQAIKEFTQFLYTDEMLEDFTRTTGVCKSGVNYDFSKSDIYSNLTAYQTTVLNLKKTFGVAYSGTESKTYLSKRDDLFFSINAPIWHPGTYKSYIEAIRAKALDGKGCFEATFIKKDVWDSNYYKA